MLVEWSILCFCVLCVGQVPVAWLVDASPFGRLVVPFGGLQTQAQFAGKRGQKQANLLKAGALHVENGRNGGFEKERKTTM